MIEEPSDDFYSDDFYRAYAALHHPDDPKPKEDRNAVEAMLQRVSEGEKDNEALLFMRHLARSILAAGGKGTPAARRADRVLNATGLAGKYEHNRAFAETATVLFGFEGVTKASCIKGAGIYDDAVFTRRKQIDSLLKRQSHVTPEKAWSSTST
mgnify:FL=1